MAAIMNQKTKILIVDDMPEILESLRRTLDIGGRHGDAVVSSDAVARLFANRPSFWRSCCAARCIQPVFVSRRGDSATHEGHGQQEGVLLVEAHS